MPRILPALLACTLLACASPAPTSPAAARSIAAITASTSAPAVRPNEPHELDLRAASTHYDFRISAGCAEPPSCTTSGTIAIFRKGDADPFQRLDLEDLTVTTQDDGTLLVNVAELYDFQATLIVGDFNFDGAEDLALQGSQDGPYGGPTFHVFLFSTREARFVESEELSNVTRETLGFFQVDSKRKRLITLAKSGCCYHVTEELAFEHGKPVPVSRTIEDATGDDVVLTIETRVGATWRRNVKHVAKN